MKIKAVIFDKDGVLVNSEQVKAIAWQRTFDQYNIKEGYSWYLSNLGPSSLYLSEKAIATFNLNENPETISCQWHNNYLMIKEDVEPITQNLKVLSTLANTYLIAVASSMDKEAIESEMLRFGYLDFIQVCVSGEDVPNNKPAPDIYLRTAEILNLKPSECVAIEDSPTGISAAKSAGLFCIGFKNPLYDLDLSQADIIEEDLTQIDFRKLHTDLQT